MTSDRNQPFAVFRTDASASIGGGHVMRCLALADALSERGWLCAFACHGETLSAMPALVDSGHPTQGPENLSASWPEGCDLLVVDHYDLDDAFEVSCRPWAKRILVIDDLTDRNHDCDILLDQTFGRLPGDYDGLVPDDCLILTGSQYALLRPQFARARYRALCRRTKAPVERILVCLGATDHNKVLDKVLDAIAACDIDLSIDVVGGDERPIPGTTFHAFVDDMAALMCAADFAIGAGGTATWERCCLGLPSIVLTTAANQQLVIRNVSEAGATAAIEDGADASIRQISDAVTALATDGSRRHDMARRAAMLCDGLGAARVAMTVKPGLSRDGRPVRLSSATLEHGEIMFEWQAASGIRRYSHNPEPPTRDQHFPWLEQKLADPDCIFNIVLCDEKPAGVLRLDRAVEQDDNFETFVVSILIAPERQGVGLGKIALKQARDMLPDARLAARIHSGNEASEGLFLDAGYTPAGDELYWNNPE